MKNDRTFFSALILIVFLWGATDLVRAEDASFRVEAPISVDQPGLVEAVLPAGLHVSSDHGLDLKVLGPEGQSRAFELYWKDDLGQVNVPLVEKHVQLREDGLFMWQGAASSKIKAARLRIGLSAGDYIGKVDVFGLKNGDWERLAKDEALYLVDGQCRTDVSIPPALYDAYRIVFTAYDQKYRRKLVPVNYVEVEGEKIGKKYIEDQISIRPKRQDEKGEIRLAVELPGTGLWIKQIKVLTSAPFEGKWQMVRQEMISGQLREVVWREGQTDTFGKGSKTLAIGIGETPPNRTFILKLKPDHYLGDLEDLSLTVRLPRLVFRADKPGIYKVQAGSGENVAVLETPSAANRGKVQDVFCGSLSFNPNWRPESLVKKFHLEGGPFDNRGYAWIAPVKVSSPGYYRLILDQKAGLEGNLEGLRIVRENQQVPYFFLDGENREVILTPETTYDKEKNTSTWIISLPRASRAWTDLVLGSSGIFDRSVAVEFENPNTRSWQSSRRENWNNLKDQKTQLRIPLNTFPDETTQLRLTILHGDNKPIQLDKISAFYRTVDLCFLADSSDGYELMGGNPSAAAPSYDLGLIKEELLAREPQAAAIGELQPFAGQGIKFLAFRAFEGTRWGLYAVLGFATLIMLFLIVRLFPEIAEEKKPRKK